jgi:hypothetical protein
MTIKKSKRKSIAVLLAALVALALLPAPVSAADTEVSILSTATFDDIKTKVTTALTNASSGDTITVTGSGTNNNATEQLELNIPAGVTLCWSRAYTGSAVGSLFRLTGSGTFEVKLPSDTAVLENTYSLGYAFYGMGPSITVTRGQVSAVQHAITVNSTTHGAITVQGAADASAGVHSSKGSAITVWGGGGVMINITGGTVSSDERHGIYVDGTTSNTYAMINISGGVLSSNMPATSSPDISGVIRINKTMQSSSINVSGGAIIATNSGNGILTQNTAAPASVSITGGLVYAQEGKALSLTMDAPNTPSVTGGTLFAYGATIAGAGNDIASIVSSTGTDRTDAFSPSGSSVVIAYDNTQPYAARQIINTTDCLTVSAGDTAKWAKSGTLSGIMSSDSSTGFFQVYGVTVGDGYTLTVTGGTIRSDVDGTSLGASRTFMKGTPVNIQANDPSGKQVFTGWTKNTTSGSFAPSSAATASSVFTLPAAATETNVTVTANFAMGYTLTVVNGVIGASGSTVTTGTFAAGQTTAIRADAVPTGQTFKEWTTNNSGSFSNGNANTNFTMPAGDVTVTATYGYRLTVSGGTGPSGGGVYAEGTPVTITAGTPPANQAFSSWTGGVDESFANGSRSSASTTFIMPANAVTVTATYVNAYTLTVSGGIIGTGGTITSGSYAAGTQVTITADDPPENQMFKEWTGGEDADFASGSRTNPSTTFTMPANAVTVTATYAEVAAIDVSVPVKLIFAAFKSDNGAVTSPDYHIINNGDTAVDVSVQSMVETDSGSLNLKDALTTDGDIRLKLQGTGSPPLLDTDWLTATMQAKDLGTLGAKSSGTDTWNFKLAGGYKGGFDVAKKPQYNITFRFALNEGP